MNELSRKKKYFEALKTLDILKIESDFTVIKDEENNLSEARVVFKVKIDLKEGPSITSHGEAELKTKNAFRLAETRAFLRALEIIYSLKGLRFEDKKEKKGPSKKQISYLKHLSKSLGKPLSDEEIEKLNENEIRMLIEKYKKELEEKK